MESGQSSATSVKSGIYFVLFCPFGIKRETEIMLHTRKMKREKKIKQISSMTRSLIKKKLTSQ